ncbi:MAG: ABC transporter ATP-binding protein [Methylovirgula sp.]
MPQEAQSRAEIVGMVLEVEHLTKDFGSSRVVDDVSFAVREGETVGLLGPNGAGKSTTIHMLLGLVEPTSGTIRMFGKSLRHHREEIFSKINMGSPYAGFPNRLTVLENLMVYARLYGVRDRQSKIRTLLGLLGIEELEDKPMLQLSFGEIARVRLCKAFLNDPKLLLLDEALGGLDPYAATLAKEALAQLQRQHGTAVLYTSHNMMDIEEMCSRVVFLRRGRVIAIGGPTEVTRAILREDRKEPALSEAFIRASRNEPHEVQ